MRYGSLIAILVVSIFWTACDSEKVDRAADFEYATIDKETDQINLMVTIRYKLKSELDKKLLRKYGRRYSDSLFLPAISAVSRNVLKDYSAGEIYNYKRDEIEQRLEEQTKTTLGRDDMELTDFLIRSVKLPDTVLHRFEKEYVVRFQTAINKCSREISGVVTEIGDLKSGKIVFYEFKVGNKNHKGVLNPEEVEEEVSLGDSLDIEYACEDAVFHRIKK